MQGVGLRDFGELPTGEKVHAYRLANASGTSVEILSYGGIIRALSVPDRVGRLEDVVLGFDRLEPYLGPHPYVGAIVGRIAGRVSAGCISADGHSWSLDRNEGPNHLHGGRLGLDRRLWKIEPVSRSDGAPSVRLSYFSPDAEEGYPGNLRIKVTYTLTQDSSFIFESEAESDRATPLSLTQHTYFNLAGEGSGSVLGHVVQILAREFVGTDANFTLSDHRQSVVGTGADLNQPRRLGDALPGIFKAHGDPYLLRDVSEGLPLNPTLAARVHEPECGRLVEVFTNEECLQFYTGVGLDGSLVGKSGKPYGAHAGLCLECEGYPNASRLQGFGDIIVRPGSVQHRRTIYAFSAV